MLTYHMEEPHAAIDAPEANAVLDVRAPACAARASEIRMGVCSLALTLAPAVVARCQRPAALFALRLPYL